MRGELEHNLRRAVQLWMLTMAGLISPYAYSLGLGEIQVNSNLGEPLKARVDLIALTAADAGEIKVRLASADEYNKVGLQYPDGIEFRFQVVNEGDQPFVSIATPRPIDDPFVNLMIEISSPSAKIVRSYTFLLDPSPDWSRALVAGGQSGDMQQTTPAQSQQTSGTSVTATTLDSKSVVAKVAVVPQSVKSDYRSKHRKQGMTSITEQTIAMPVQIEGGSRAKNRSSKPFGKLSLSLSKWLTISKSDPGTPGSLKDSGDAMQEELIAKEKTINELHLQISEMQALISNLQAKLVPSGTSAIADSANVSRVVSAVTESAVPPSKPAIAVTAVTVAGPINWSEIFQQYWKNISASLALLLAVGGAIYWYSKWKMERQYVTFDTFSEIPEQSALVRPSAVVPESFSTDVQSIHTPIHVKNKIEHVSPNLSSIEKTRTAAPLNMVTNAEETSSPLVNKRDVDEMAEVDSMLEEAELYAIHGRQGRAIEMLNDIIQTYPEKTEVWLLLLSFFRNKEQAPQFENIAKKFLNIMGTNSAWKGIQEAGRSIDPYNPLYFDPDSTSYSANTEKITKLNKRRLLGEILVDMKAISEPDLKSSLTNFDHLRDGRLGNYLVAKGLIKQDQLDEALQQQSKEKVDEPPPASRIDSGAQGPLIELDKPRSIGDVLVHMGVVTELELEHVLANYDPKRHGRCGTYLVTTGLITEKQLHAALLQQLGSEVEVERVISAKDSPSKDSDDIPWDVPDRSIR
jgi:hypothetical protein